MNTVESDAFAVAMLVVIFSGLGVIGLLLWCMRWRSSRRDHHVDALLEEIAEEARSPVAHQTKHESRADWERDADWWKNQSSGS
ncbi:MAG: hypothetical protein RI957_2153 [Verrucomicrobiota bacterium]|jgi:hypothetical protein